MSFEMKYNRDGEPLKQSQPQFAEVAPAASIDEADQNFVQQASEQDSVVSELETVVDNLEKTEDSVSAVEDNSAAVAAQTKPTPQESWKIVRERAEAAERRAAELERQLAQRQESKQPQEDLEFSIDEDALAEGKHLNKVQKKIRAMEDKLKQYEQQNALQDVRSRLKSQYSDWDNVFNEQNLARLQEQEPEIAYALNSASDPYKAGISAYKMIKKLGIIPTQDVYTQEKAIVQKNAAKPKTMASLNPQQGSSPLSQANAFANGLTDELRTQMLQEMNQARKGY